MNPPIRLLIQFVYWREKKEEEEDENDKNDKIHNEINKNETYIEIQP